MKAVKLLILLFIPLLLACTRQDDISMNPNTDEVKDGIFVHISKGPADVHEVMMGLMIANKFSDTHDVILFFDIDGIGMVLGDAPDLTLEPFGSSDKLFEKLTEKGIKIMACPACLTTAGKTAADLRPGVIVAEKDLFFSFTKGRILTLDY
ncbi:MAG: DsrE family protein [Bacteroidota bacterium]